MPEVNEAPHGPVPTPLKVHSRGQVLLLSALAAVWLFAVDFLGSIPLGGISVSGVLTIMSAVLLLVLLPSITPQIAGTCKQRDAGLGSWTLLLFPAYALVRLIIDFDAAGLQNVCVYIGFILTIVIVGAAGREGDAEAWGRVLLLAGGGATVSYLINHFAGMGFLGDRSFALSAMICLALAVTYRNGWLAHILPWLIVLGAVVSLSRTATIVCLAMLVGLVSRLHPRWRVAGTISLVLGIAVAVVALYLFYPPFQDRFTTGDAAVAVGGTSLNTSGRTALWAVAYEDALRAPLLGHGPGAAGELMQRAFPGTGHPHNDYLRLFEDLGLVGVTLWMLALTSLFASALRRVRALDRPIDWAALLCTLAIVLASITDNVIVYAFVMIPAGAVIGLSRGAPGTTALAEGRTTQWN